MYLLFDIGGTKTRLAFSEDGKTFEKPEIFPTAENFKEGMKSIKDATEKIAKGRKISVAAGGIAGTLSEDKKETLVLPNIPTWQEKPIVKALESIFNAPVFLENDSAVVGLGEAVFGVGKGEKIVSYITVSTGVGGVRIVNGKIDENRFGFEPGHQIIDFEEAHCADCSVKGELEDYVSGHSLEKRLKKSPKDISDKKIWEELARVLAYGINNVIVFWSPDVVVLGGSMMNEPGIKVEKVKLYLKDILKIFPKHPKIEHSSLGDLGGIYGAMALANQKMKSLNFKN